MKQPNLVYYSDASHGWLKAPRQLLIDLGILEKITAYSYQSETGFSVYLEEDCDASIFLKALEAKGITPIIRDVDHGSRSYIRSLWRFKA